MQKSGYRIIEKIGKYGVINFECNPFYSQLYYWWDINEGKGKHNVSFPPELLFRSLKFYLRLWTYVYFIQFKCVLLNIACIITNTYMFALPIQKYVLLRKITVITHFYSKNDTSSMNGMHLYCNRNIDWIKFAFLITKAHPARNNNSWRHQWEIS